MQKRKPICGAVLCFQILQRELWLFNLDFCLEFRKPWDGAHPWFTWQGTISHRSHNVCCLPFYCVSGVPLAQRPPDLISCYQRTFWSVNDCRSALTDDSAPLLKFWVEEDTENPWILTFFNLSVDSRIFINHMMWHVEFTRASMAQHDVGIASSIL